MQFQVSKVSGDHDAFPIPVSEPDPDLSGISWKTEQYDPYGKLLLSKALTGFGCLNYFPSKVLLLCENLFYAILQSGSLLSLLHIACNAYSYCYATF